MPSYRESLKKTLRLSMSAEKAKMIAYRSLKEKAGEINKRLKDRDAAHKLAVADKALADANA